MNANDNRKKGENYNSRIKSFKQQQYFFSFAIIIVMIIIYRFLVSFVFEIEIYVISFWAKRMIAWFTPIFISLGHSMFSYFSDLLIC